MKKYTVLVKWDVLGQERRFMFSVHAIDLDHAVQKVTPIKGYKYMAYSTEDTAMIVPVEALTGIQVSA